jgi:hypothetical protein
LKNKKTIKYTFKRLCCREEYAKLTYAKTKAHYGGGATWAVSWHGIKYTPPKCVAFNFGFYFLCLGFIFS